MKRFKFIFIWFTLMAANASGQMMNQTDSSIYHTTRIIPVDKANLLKNVDVIFNMQYANNSDFQNGEYNGSNFAMNQFRLEIRGYILDNVFFRFRNRYTRDPIPQSVDNIDHSVDMAFVGINISPKLILSFGKLSADYGGYEFLANPIYIYQYNDIIAHSDAFLAGVQATWNISASHSLTFQVLNARTQTFSQIYDSIPGIKPAKFPVNFVGNWRGIFADGKFRTFWSYALLVDAKHEYIQYTALGNQLSLKKWLIQYDFSYNPEDIDRTIVVTSIIPKSYSPFAALKTKYIEHWLHCEYSLVPQWKTTITGMVSDAYWYGNPDPNKNSHLRSAYGIIPSIEFYPIKKFNLKFFTAYVGRYYNYTNYAKYKFGLTNYTTGTIMVGFISPLVFL